ncbi:hypothetical protein [Streptomyces liangshanensis]|uniref:Uncharacterized protein n=1 Tax=Streptomyces liangshanensis TaxID=2717324 RepID=A0A6G9H191_9ACTN|nr:hypothetical protein [Streptomyces liangshanensis]QIQ04086.1 hypothetical protein HA039_18800 [Streptomyces liangshanensis]
MTRSHPEGYDPGDRDAASPVPDTTHGEHELRVLLERATPHLGAPAGRMAQVRRRVVRRRRRRAALGAAVTGVATVAVLVTFLRPFAPGEAAAPAPVGSSLRGGPAATDSPESTKPPTSSPTRAPKNASGLPIAGFADLGLKLTLSTGWTYGRVAAGTPSPTDFVTNQPLVARDTCPAGGTGLYACAPVATPLRDDGVVVTFVKTNKPHLPYGDKKDAFTFDKPVPAGDSCRLLGGDQELTGWGQPRTADNNRLIAVDAFICLRKPTAMTVLVFQKFLARAIVYPPST